MRLVRQTQDLTESVAEAAVLCDGTPPSSSDYDYDTFLEQYKVQKFFLTTGSY